MARKDNNGENENPEKKPLDQVVFEVHEDGVTIDVPALDKRWIKEKIFSKYIGLVVAGGKLKADADLEEWMHEAGWFQKDMEFLLNCKHHEFWSYMVYDKSALVAVVSFLQHANPFYLDIRKQTADSRVLELYEAIRNSVLRVVCRLITSQESPEAWITREHLRELLYTNFLITIPMLLDLIVAVGDSNKHNVALLSNIFETVFSLEPRYRKDLTTALEFFKVAFQTIQMQTENEGCDGAGGGVPYEYLNTPYDDVVLYTLDVAFTLSILMKVFPDVQCMCYEVQLAQSIAQFYDNTIPSLYKNVFLINEEACSLSWLNMARVQLLKSFRRIASSYVTAAIVNPFSDESTLAAESLVSLLTECLSERIFVIDYQRKYSVEYDMDLLRQVCKDFHQFEADFVTKGYQQEADSHSSVAKNIRNSTAGKQNLKPISTQAKVNSSNNKDSAQNDRQQQPTRNIDLEVTAALEIMPHLGTGFLRRVLLRYENSEDAIAAILEGNLPPDLINADQTEVYIPPDPQDTLYNQTGIKHFNIYDGDPYDIMTQDNPSCIIKQGKGFPGAPRNASELLDDKRDLQSIRHRYQEYSVVVDEVLEDNEYDDEYDDSYESVLESETRVTRSKQMQAGLADVKDVSERESDDSEDENGNDAEPRETKGHRENPSDFCENPEAIRARYEAKREAKKNGAGRCGRSKEQSTTDVAGAPKGKGQNDETLRNRKKKEVHKSSRANHNRKAGSAYKRSKGMFG